MLALLWIYALLSGAILAIFIGGLWVEYAHDRSIGWGWPAVVSCLLVGASPLLPIIYVLVVVGCYWTERQTAH